VKRDFLELAGIMMALSNDQRKESEKPTCAAPISAGPTSKMSIFISSTSARRSTTPNRKTICAKAVLSSNLA